MGQLSQEVYKINRVTITHQIDKNCFVLTVENTETITKAITEAILEYQLLQNNSVDFTRTYVPNQFRGKGLAEKLVRHGLAWASEQGFSIRASCWYVDKFLR